MQRRDVLKLLTSTALLSAMPMELLQSLQQARAQAAPTIGLRTLNAHQNATIMAITEMIIPATSTPGANGAKVNEFIDLMLTDWYDKADSDRFLQGLAAADADSHKRFGKTFIQCTPKQQHDLMTAWDFDAMKYAQAAKAAHKSKTDAPPMNFFYMTKRLTLVGYYTSEIGFTKELGKTIIPMKHAGCAPLSEARA